MRTDFFFHQVIPNYTYLCHQHVLMKTKLTLTVSDRVIRKAKRHSRKTGKSLSRMFEELFDEDKKAPLKSEAQRAAERLLRQLGNSKPIKVLNDEALLQKHMRKKYA